MRCYVRASLQLKCEDEFHWQKSKRTYLTTHNKKYLSCHNLIQVIANCRHGKKTGKMSANEGRKDDNEFLLFGVVSKSTYIYPG